MSNFASGFLSYARLDDEREGGRITRLRDAIQAEFATLTGETIDIFIDREGIQWGDPFRRRLAEALQSTTFFIPVLTPTYFLREECRNEMQRFVSSARELGLEELLLSIRYVPVPDLSEDSTDELKAIAAAMQYEDLTELRFENENSAAYRKRVNDLALRLVDLTHALEQRPSSEAPSGTTFDSKATNVGDAEHEGEEDDAPGLMDLLADLQPAAEAWRDNMLAFSPALDPFNQAFNDAGEEMAAAGSASNPFAARVLIARRLAEDITEPLERIEELSKEYSSMLLRIDPAIGAFIESAALLKNDFQVDDPEQIDSAVDSLKELIAGSRGMHASVGRAAQVAGSTAKMSRDLRPALRRFQEAMRNITDGQSLIDEWDQKLQSLGLND
jgi:hypothetical protein